MPTGYLWLNFRYSFGGDLHPHQFYYPKLHFYIVGLVYGMSFAAPKFFRAGWSWVGPSISLCGCSLTYWQDAIGAGLRALLLTDLCCTSGEEKHEVFDEHAPVFSGERPISIHRLTRGITTISVSNTAGCVISMPPFYHVVELSSWMRIMAKHSTISRMVR